MLCFIKIYSFNLKTSQVAMNDLKTIKRKFWNDLQDILG
jgi:hypothetical protein